MEEKGGLTYNVFSYWWFLTKCVLTNSTIYLVLTKICLLFRHSPGTGHRRQEVCGSTYSDPTFSPGRVLYKIILQMKRFQEDEVK